MVERDELPNQPVHRKGTPQSHHANNLVPGALPHLERWFPGITKEFADDGATRVGSNLRFIVNGVRLARPVDDLGVLLMTRPLLDAKIRKRLRAFDNLIIATHRDVRGLVFDGDDIISGVRVHTDGEGPEEVIPSDFVVDAMGRGTKTRGWLEKAGYPPPPSTETRIRVRYATRLFRRRGGDLDGDSMAVVGATAGCERGAVAFAVEGPRWLVTLFAYGGVSPPTDLTEFRNFAQNLVVPDVGMLVSDVEPCSEAATVGYPTTRLYHYDRLRRSRMPRGYVAIGDALSSNNPSYGQGIASAAFQATELEKVLVGDLEGLEARYYPRAVKAAAQAFEFAWGNDANLPSVDAPVPPMPKLVGRYLRRAIRVAGRDPVVSGAILRVGGLVDRPWAMMRPRVALRVLRG